MSDKEKFIGFKKILLQKNERSYGNELRKKYGGDCQAVESKKSWTWMKKRIRKCSRYQQVERNWNPP